MRILFISNYTDSETIVNQLRDLCEGSSLVVLNTIESARNFITDEICVLQNHLDLVIMYDSVGGVTANSFKRFIKDDHERTFSLRNFNLDTLPIALIVRAEINKNSYSGFDVTLDDIGYDRLNKLVPDFRLAIKNWRYEVVEELRGLGVIFNKSGINYNKLISNRNLKSTPTKIISESYKGLPRPLNYYWLNFNKIKVEKSIHTYSKLLRRSERIGKKGEEKTYHHFFLKNAPFLLRDTFSSYLYEHKLAKSEDRYEEPDFLLMHNLNSPRDLSLLEVKLPNENFVTKKTYHPPLTARLYQHLRQVNDYKEYFENEGYFDEIEKTVGFNPASMHYNLLMGRKENKEENLHELEINIRQLNQGHINLITFDELKEYQEDFFERMLGLDILL